MGDVANLEVAEIGGGRPTHQGSARNAFELVAEDRPRGLGPGQQMVVARKRDEPRLRDEHGQLLAEPHRHTQIVLSMHDERRTLHLACDVQDVDLSELIQEAHRVLRVGRSPLQLVECVPVGAAALGEELRGEHLAERGVVSAPSDAGQLTIEIGGAEFLFAHRADRATTRVCAAQHQFGHPIGMLGGIRDRYGSALRNAQQREVSSSRASTTDARSSTQSSNVKSRADQSDSPHPRSS